MIPVPLKKDKFSVVRVDDGPFFFRRELRFVFLEANLLFDLFAALERLDVLGCWFKSWLWNLFVQTGQSKTPSVYTALPLSFQSN